MYTFLDAEVARRGLGGIPDAALDDSARAFAGHIAAHAATLRPQAPLDATLARVRAFAALALLAFTPEAPTRRLDLADRLALTGARRGLMTDLGLLLLDSGGADDLRVATARPRPRWLRRLRCWSPMRHA